MSIFVSVFNSLPFFLNVKHVFQFFINKSSKCNYNGRKKSYSKKLHNKKYNFLIVGDFVCGFYVIIVGQSLAMRIMRRIRMSD